MLLEYGPWYGMCHLFLCTQNRNSSESDKNHIISPLTSNEKKTLTFGNAMFIPRMRWDKLSTYGLKCFFSVLCPYLQWKTDWRLQVHSPEIARQTQLKVNTENNILNKKSLVSLIHNIWSIPYMKSAQGLTQTKRLP